MTRAMVQIRRSGRCTLTSCAPRVSARSGPFSGKRRRVFDSLDFELQREIGTLEVKQTPLLPFSPDRAYDRSGEGMSERITLFAARYSSGLPNEPVANVVLKECDAASEFATRELRAMTQLCSAGTDDPVLQLATQLASTDRTASFSSGLLSESDFTLYFKPWLSESNSADEAALAQEPPFAPVLGSFVAAPISDNVQSESAVYIVQRWSASSVPLLAYPQAEQESFRPRLWPPIVRVKDTAWNMRRRFIRRVAFKSVEALAKLHACGVAHAGLGADSMLLSSADDRKYSRVRVRMGNFGVSRIASVDDDVPEAMHDDCRTLSASLLAFTIASMCPSADMPYTGEEECRRLLEATGTADAEELRGYIASISAKLGPAIQLLDVSNGAGWRMLSQLCNAGTAESTLEAATEWYKANSDVARE